MNADKALELARLAYPNDENLRVAYMLGLNAGAEWQESQMVKDEVEGEIFDYVEGLIGNIEFNIDSRFEKGDKVRIIIVKED